MKTFTRNTTLIGLIFMGSETHGVSLSQFSELLRQNCKLDAAQRLTIFVLHISKRNRKVLNI